MQISYRVYKLKSRSKNSPVKQDPSVHSELHYCFGEGRLGQKKPQHLQWPQAPLERLNQWLAYCRTCETRWSPELCMVQTNTPEGSWGPRSTSRMSPEGPKCLKTSSHLLEGIFFPQIPSWPPINCVVVIEQNETHSPPPKVPCCRSIKRALTWKLNTFGQRKN